MAATKRPFLGSEASGVLHEFFPFDLPARVLRCVYKTDATTQHPPTPYRCNTVAQHPRNGATDSGGTLPCRHRLRSIPGSAGEARIAETAPQTLTPHTGQHQPCTRVDQTNPPHDTFLLATSGPPMPSIPSVPATAAPRPRQGPFLALPPHTRTCPLQVAGTP